MTMFELPKSWRQSTSGYEMQPVETGLSVAGVVRLYLEGSVDFFVKYETLETAPELSELEGESERLRWLAEQDVPSPDVLDYMVEAGRRWLLVTGLPGRDLAASSTPSAELKVEIVEQALRKLHSLDPGNCPFDARLDVKICQARARMEKGCVDESLFDKDRLGQSPSDLFEDLISERPVEQAEVVTHGDPCLPNLISDRGNFSGFIDCGRLGVADPAQDIAIAARSIGSNLGRCWRDEFLSRFGYTSEDSRLAYYRLLDEFF